MLNIFFIIFAFFLHLFCFLFQQRIFFFLFQQRIKTNYTNFTNYYFSISRMIIFDFTNDVPLWQCLRVAKYV